MKVDMSVPEELLRLKKEAKQSEPGQQGFTMRSSSQGGAAHFQVHLCMDGLSTNSCCGLWETTSCLPEQLQRFLYKKVSRGFQGLQKAVHSPWQTSSRQALTSPETACLPCQTSISGLFEGLLKDFPCREPNSALTTDELMQHDGASSHMA